MEVHIIDTCTVLLLLLPLESFWKDVFCGYCKLHSIFKFWEGRTFFFSVSYQIKILVLQINKKKNSILLFNVQNSLEYRTFKCNKNKNLDKTMLLSLSTKVSQWNHVHFISSKSHEDNIFSFIYLLIWPTNFTNGPMGDYKKY